MTEKPAQPSVSSAIDGAFGVERPEDLSQLSVMKAPGHLLERYRSLVLISHEKHLAETDILGGDSLAICSDWLLWRKCVDQGGHCLHFESALADGLTLEGPEDELYLRYTDWSQVGGRDDTLFEGVSLGRLFWREVTLACLAYDRLSQALDRLCRRFQPAELVLYDARSDGNLLDSETCRRLVAGIAARHGAAFVDRYDPLGGDHPELAERSVYGIPAKEPGWRTGARRGYAAIADLIFRLRWNAGSRKPKIHILNNPIVVNALTDSGRDRAVTAAILAEQWPKGAGFLSACWKQGVMLVGPVARRLNRADKKNLAAMIRRFQARWAEPAPETESARRAFIRREVFESGQLHRWAGRVKGYRRLFQRHATRRVMVGDITNGECRAVAEAARSLNIPCDELLNGPFLNNQRNDARIGSGGSPATVNRLLAWGARDEDWAKRAAPGVRCVRTGYPPVTALRDRPKRAPGRNHWLVLPWYPDADDVRALRTNTFSTLVDVLQMLNDLGHENIRVKIHPGGPFAKSYFERVLDYYGLACPIIGDGPLLPHLEWADYVTGPANSGALVEALAMGRPYFALRPWPSSVDPRYVSGIPILSSATELRRALATGSEPDAENVLQYFCSVGDIPDAASCVWDALEQGAAKQHMAGTLPPRTTENGIPDFSLGPPAHLHQRYRQLLLVSREDQLAGTDLLGGEVLAVCFDWLLWRKCSDAGMHCLHFEAGLVDWDADEALGENMFLKANHWVFRDGRDATLFHGVSLGKQFVREVTRFRLAVLRIRTALDWFCRTYTPGEIVLIDCRTDDWLFDDHMKKALVAEAAARTGATLVDRLHQAPPPGHAPQSTLWSGLQNVDFARMVLRRTYAVVVDAVFTLIDRLCGHRAKRILLMPTGAMGRGLLRSFDRRGIRPVLLAEQHPKNLKFLWFCLRSGILLRRLGWGRLSRDDKRALGAMTARLMDMKSAPREGVGRLVDDYVGTHIIGAGRLVQMAREVRRVEGLFDRQRNLHRVMVSDDLNPANRLYIEVGRHRGVPSDEIPHGPRFTVFKHEPLCGDHCTGPIVSRFLAWGPQTQEWLSLMGAKIPSVCTGHPAYYRGFPQPAPPTNRRDARILFLPCVFMIEDYGVPSADCYGHMLTTLIDLQRQGFHNLAVKLHPGLQNEAAYQNMLEYYGVDAALHREGDLATHVDWADLVIGPVQSSCMFEVLMEGKPYIPVLLPASRADRRLLRNLRPVTNAEELQSAMNSELEQEWRAVLADHLSVPDIADPSENLWRALVEDRAAPEPEGRAAPGSELDIDGVRG